MPSNLRYNWKRGSQQPNVARYMFCVPSISCKKLMRDCMFGYIPVASFDNELVDSRQHINYKNHTCARATLWRTSSQHPKSHFKRAKPDQRPSVQIHDNHRLVMKNAKSCPMQEGIVQKYLQMHFTFMTFVSWLHKIYVHLKRPITNHKARSNWRAKVANNMR